MYDCQSQKSIEEHIVDISFLGKELSVHERIKSPLKNVEAKIQKLSETDKGAKDFINNLLRADGYYWREIRDRFTKSFHSFGIAVDLLPKAWGRKIVYWSWQRDIAPDTWMLTPLSSRWMPPDSVIKIFEEAGFIWGGKWAVWDNMHFEYHPEIILYTNMINARHGE